MLHEFLNLINNNPKVSSQPFSWVSVVEIALITAFLFTFYAKFIKNTQSEKLVKGILFLIVGWYLGEFLIYIDLSILGMFLKGLVFLISLSLIVIFQPELRRFLGYLGQPGFMSMNFFRHPMNIKSEESIDVVKEIIEAVKYLSKTRTGALIVFQKDMTTGMYSDVGTKLNADVSTELILTIFHINTPLHDGAMIIKDAKILSAGVLLPLTEDPKLSWKYGTRHRAAIGMSEVSDAACLVVSEETGDVSVSIGGILKKYEDLATLKKDLMNILGYENENSEIAKKSMISKIMNKKTSDSQINTDTKI